MELVQQGHVIYSDGCMKCQCNSMYGFRENALQAKL